jgi:hypothetical protein
MSRPFWRPIITVLALVILGACSDNSSTAPTTASTTVASSPTTTATTPPGSSTNDHNGPATVESTPLTGGGARTIAFNADQVGSTPRTETVARNTPVTITITTATPQEFHLHGYDLEFTDKLQFTADQAGTFELESHKTSKVLMILVVTP